MQRLSTHFAQPHLWMKTTIWMEYMDVVVLRKAKKGSSLSVCLSDCVNMVELSLGLQQLSQILFCFGFVFVGGWLVSNHGGMHLQEHGK